MQDKAALACASEKMFSGDMREGAMTVQMIAGFQPDIPSTRRGACPTLAQPMQTGDGLLARLRPVDCRSTLAQLRAIANAAAECGNGIIEVTARGSLQIRGLRTETVGPFEAAVLDAGVIPASGLMVEVPPLAGMDPAEMIDPRPAADEIRKLVSAHVPALALAPKLAVIVDGGGRFHLGAVSADVRLTATDPGHFLLAVGGDNVSARQLGIVSRETAAQAVLQILKAIAATGAGARGRDVDLLLLGELADSSAEKAAIPATLPTIRGMHKFDVGDHECWILGLSLPYRQARSADIIAFLDEIEILGASDIRLSPDHGLMLTGLHEGEARQAERAARRHGFWTSPAEPRAAISLCAGNLACLSGHFDTRAAGEEICNQASLLLDGSITLHLSGCRKGCAHPAPAALTLSGAPTGFEVVVNGTASDAPAAHIAANDLGIALRRLASRIADAKEAGETARDVLHRLGTAEIVAALKLDGQ